MDPESKIVELEKRVADLEMAIGILLNHCSDPYFHTIFPTLAEKETGCPISYYINNFVAKRRAHYDDVVKK